MFPKSYASDDSQLGAHTDWNSFTKMSVDIQASGCINIMCKVPAGVSSVGIFAFCKKNRYTCHMILVGAGCIGGTDGDDTGF